MNRKRNISKRWSESNLPVKGQLDFSYEEYKHLLLIFKKNVNLNRFQKMNKKTHRPLKELKIRTRTHPRKIRLTTNPDTAKDKEDQVKLIRLIQMTIQFAII